MASWIRVIPPGKIVLAAVADEAASNLNSGGYNALYSIGKIKCLKFKFL